MNAATSPFALAAEFLAEFIAGVLPVWPANGCLVSDWEDGSLDQALQALRADDGPTALGMLALAQQQTAAPVGDDEENHLDLPAAQQERQHMHLAARVATALTREAMRQPAPRIAWNEPPEGEELLIFTLEDTQGDAPQDEALEPLELPEEYELNFELLALPAPVPLPSAAADLNPSPQG
jgi:hypothetical protein